MPRMRKIALMGYRSVGKSTLTAQYIDGKTNDFYDPTVENSKYPMRQFPLLSLTLPHLLFPPASNGKEG